MRRTATRNRRLQSTFDTMPLSTYTAACAWLVTVHLADLPRLAAIITRHANPKGA
jgi:hypothetical protein